MRTKTTEKNGSPIKPIAHRMKNRVKVKARLDPVAKVDFNEFTKIASTFRKRIAGIPEESGCFQDLFRLAAMIPLSINACLNLWIRRLLTPKS